jgi:FtsH-binding integral membrane protein
MRARRVLVGSRLVRRLAIFVDLLIVLVFVAIGRSVHDHGVNLVGMLSTAWPFVTGLVLGWIIVSKRHHSGSSLLDGSTICVVTVFVGMVLRVVAGQRTAAAFVLVALCFLGASMLGWRFAVDLRRRLRRA